MARKRHSSLLEAYRPETPMASPSLEARLLEPGIRPSPKRVPLLKPVIAVGVAAALAAGFIAMENRAGAQSNQDLAGVSRTFLWALADGNAAAALEVCAEGVEGHEILAAERRRVFGALPGTDAYDLDARESRLKEIGRLREELAGHGVRWKGIQPLAVGGVRARVLQASQMKAPASLVWGHLYFSDAGRVFEIEVTAWQCGDRFIITDIWDWSPVDTSPDDVESFAKSRARDQIRDQKEMPEDTKIIRPRRVFLPI